MKRNTLVSIGLILIFLWNCSSQSDRKRAMNDDIILPQADGTISLKLDNAACYTDLTDPSSNTAEWEMSISKPGRYKVWLSSATKDTVALGYTNKVKINLMDNKLEVSPACDKVIANSQDTSYPYFRADSYMGTFYISEAGVYNIQVISEKILPKELREQTASLSETTKMMSIILVPLTR